MSTKRALTIIVVLCCGLLATGQQRSHKISARGTSNVSAQINGKTVRASFATSEIGANDRPSRFAQCTGGKNPCSLTEKIRVWINQSEVFLPRSSYADLGDIVSVAFTTSNKRWVMVVEGGDASEAYIAKFFFVGDRLTQRELYSAEEPTKRLESTRYFEVVSD